MAKAKNSYDYCKQWKEHVVEVAGGPILSVDLAGNEELADRMRKTLGQLLDQIDEAGRQLVKDGVFEE